MNVQISLISVYSRPQNRRILLYSEILRRSGVFTAAAPHYQPLTSNPNLQTTIENFESQPWNSYFQPYLFIAENKI